MATAVAHDVYHERRLFRDGVVPASLVLSGPGYRRQMVGIDVPQDIYVHIAGIDVIRDVDGRLLVLEDNLRTPSGVSYVLENRDVTTRIMPTLFQGSAVRPVNHTTASKRLRRSFTVFSFCGSSRLVDDGRRGRRQKAIRGYH